jgi:hypothetical protein
MFPRPKLQTGVGIVLTALGLLGIFISFSVQKSDFDPTALMISFVSISVSIIGISLIMERAASGDNRSPIQLQVDRRHSED